MKKNNSFESRLSSLNDIVDKLENGNVPLEDALKEFEVGVKLFAECQSQIKDAELKIKMIQSNVETGDWQENDYEES